MGLDVLNGKIRVYNYETSPVGFPSQHGKNGVFFRGRDEDEEYVVERVSFDDVESENSKSDIFKVGRLRFNPEEEDEIYKKLGIEDRSNIITDRELIGLLKDDSIENIKHISKLKSQTLLSRMKSMLFSMERNGTIPPHGVTSAVVERLNELQNGGKRNPNSEINKILEMDKKKNEENKLKETVELLSKQVEQLQKESDEKDKMINQSQTALTDLLKMVEQLKSGEVKNETKADVKEESKTESKTTKKSAGRPKKN